MARQSNDDARFRVSDVYEVPLRGVMLRLKVADGSPSMKRLKSGSPLTLVSPAGDRRTVHVKDIGVISGRASQDRLETTGEIDILVSGEEGLTDPPVEIGWTAEPGEANR